MLPSVGGFPRGHSPNGDGLDVDEFAYAVDAQLASVARMFHATKRQARVGGDHPVHKNLSCLDFVDETVALVFIAGPDAGAQAEWRIVGPADGGVDIGHAKQRGHRTE